jgi:prepilin-type N-terminal cleavage/methylation domain-containing protein
MHGLISRKRKGFTLIELMIVIAIIAILAAILVPNFIRARAQGQLTACKSNLKNIGTAMEMYSTDNSGRYPSAMGSLTPNYLKVIPTCPSRGSDTYTGSFTSTSNPDSYTIYCNGSNHAGASVSPNYPQGAYAGTTHEAKSMYLRPGTYNVEIREQGHTQYAEKVYVVAGKTLHLHPEL